MSERPTVYRYKLSADMTMAISQFASVHAYDSRREYKAHWQTWIIEHASLVAAEDKRLTSMGYTGDLGDKMYKAGRYYFRKRSIAVPEAPKERRVYVGASRDLLTAMDQFLALGQLFPSRVAPALLYQRFVESDSYHLLVSREIQRLASLADISERQAADKVKKTFKNRYYTHSHKLTGPVQ